MTGSLPMIPTPASISSALLRETWSGATDHCQGCGPFNGRPHEVLRDSLSVETRNGLGSIATFFRASQDTSDELWAKAVPLDVAAADASPPPAVKVQQDDAGQTAETILREEVREKAEQFIEDRIASLDWQQMQELVAGILRAMGYHETNCSRRRRSRRRHLRLA